MSTKAGDFVARIKVSVYASAAENISAAEQIPDYGRIVKIGPYIQGWKIVPGLMQTKVQGMLNDVVLVRTRYFLLCELSLFTNL